MAARLRVSSYDVEVDQEYIDVTSERPSPNERWRHTDSNGHEHRYDHGYPTLEFVVDAEHWCDGTEGFALHDPHMHVDEGHYECQECRERIEPKMDPPYTPKSIPGLRSAYITGPRSDGLRVRVVLTGDELTQIADAQSFAPGQVDDVCLRIVDAAPDERILETTYTG
jgi:hypothetical protein